MREYHIRKVDRTLQTVRWRQTVVQIVTTPQHVGVRRWFACPECSKRCAILYAPDDTRLACGRCLGISYPSQRQSPAQRIRTQADALFRRLNVDASHFPRCLGPKPPGMAWARYRALLDKALEYDERTCRMLVNVGVAAVA
jgi:ribosomal protein S27AE